MPTKIIVSYDGTANEDDAIALGALFGRAGADVAIAYVRHAHEQDSSRETAAQAEAQELLRRGAELLGDPAAHTHVVTDRSTPEGLAALAEAEEADVIVFCSDSHTAKGHVSIGNSAQRLIEGGRTAIAIAPVDFAEREQAGAPRRIVAVGDGEGGARETAHQIAAALSGEVAPVANDDADLLVVDSRAEAEPGRVSISSSAAYLIDVASCPVLILARGKELEFDGPSVRSSTAA